jgi:hypothetical protein
MHDVRDLNEILVFFCLKGLFTPTESLLKVSQLPTLRVRMCLFSIGYIFSKDLHRSVISENAKRFNKKKRGLCFLSVHNMNKICSDKLSICSPVVLSWHDYLCPRNRVILYYSYASLFSSV